MAMLSSDHSNPGSSEDQALIGDTRNPLHFKPLPKSMGPNYGYGKEVPTDEVRSDKGKGNEFPSANKPTPLRGY